jgi:RimJ/RimL family protein N-acetyltransferase
VTEIIRTERLLLRPFALADAPAVTALVSVREIASTTVSIPHPYNEAMAEAWIGTHSAGRARGDQYTFAITVPEGDELVGAVGLAVNQQNRRAELGYWTGLPYWGRGYGTEAAAAILRFGFETLGLHRIFAHHMTRNPASGRIMEKIGMRHEGSLRGHVLKWGVHEDLELYGILREDFERGTARIAG